MVYFNVYDKDNKVIKSYSTDICYDTSDNNYIKLTAYGQAKEKCKYKKTKYILKKENFNAEQEPEKIINNAAIVEEPEQNYIPIAKPKRKTSDKQLQHIKNYLKDKAEIKVWLEKDFKEEIKDHCAKNNISVNQYILNLIAQDMHK